MPDKPIYQIKVTLRGVAPPIWRRIAVAGDTPLDELHDILQVAMGWIDSHLHAFRAGRAVYGMSDVDDTSGMKDETGVRLDGIAAEGDTLLYEYDFGDGWEHELTIEKVLPPEEGARYPRCLAGERACPPEDCGGVWGYENLLQTLRDPDHEEYDEIGDWLGEDFDPEAFDAEEVNTILNDELEEIFDDLYEEQHFTEAELAALDEPSLIDTLRTLGDRAPRNLIDACAARGEAMVLALDNLLGAPRFWGDDLDAGYWWLRVHAAMLLGLIATESAGAQLVELMRRLDIEEDEETQEWLAGEWPALFANKPATVAREVRGLAEDREHDWYTRSYAAESYLSFAQREGEAAFEAALDWAAALAADEQEDWSYRLSLGSQLVDFARERHRALLDGLAARQSGSNIWFDAREIKAAYARGRDEPEWERFADPWAFYDPDAIAVRQARWAMEAEDPDPEWDWDSSPARLDPYVRPDPKIGRNDPCPCGSGKKYKKCCLGKT